MPGRRPQTQASAAARVIDLHVHINPWHLLPPGVREALRRTQPQFDRIRRYVEDPRAFLERMDEERIERVGLINYVAPEVMGYTPAVNAWAARYASVDRRRLVPFGGFHPRHARQPRREIDRLLHTYEMGGIKIHGPHMLLAPNAYLDGARALRLLYERCEEEGVPVMFHTGTTVFPGARNKFGDPLLLDDVAVDFPKLKIILAHGGRPLWMETAAFLVRRHPNVWLEISSVPPRALLEYFPRLEELSQKALFGSDWPGPHVPGMRANADAVAALPLSSEAKRRMLYENARRLLG